MERETIGPPGWWVLYLILVVLMPGGLWLVEWGVPAGGLRQALEVVAVVGSYWVASRWLRAHRAAIDIAERDLPPSWPFDPAGEAATFPSPEEDPPQASLPGAGNDASSPRRAVRLGLLPSGRRYTG